MTEPTEEQGFRHREYWFTPEVLLFLTNGCYHVSENEIPLDAKVIQTFISEHGDIAEVADARQRLATIRAEM